jgi:enoyl-[acyl-carrier-protein] reductase (NADH)
VNAIAPGPFKTNLGGGGPMPPEAEARWNAVIPLGRMGDPTEIRGLALLLASSASSFMTGGVYPVDGGALLQGPSLPSVTDLPFPPAAAQQRRPRAALPGSFR